MDQCRENIFQIWASTDGIAWTYYAEGDQSFHMIRKARDDSRGGRLLKVMNAELNVELIRFIDGQSLAAGTAPS